MKVYKKAVSYCFASLSFLKYTKGPLNYFIGINVDLRREKFVNSIIQPVIELQIMEEESKFGHMKL